jgi:hypothetical protein
MAGSKQALRVGVILGDDASIPVYALCVLEAICEDERFSLGQLLRTGVSDGRGSSLFGAIMRVEAAVFSRPRKFSAPKFTSRRRDLRDTSLDAIGSQMACDVYIDFTCDPRTLDLASCARFGLWQLSSNDSIAGFYEALNSAPTTVSILLRYIRKKDPPREIARATYNTKFIASRNGAFVREKAGQLIIRELKRLWLTGEVADNGAASISMGTNPRAGDLLTYGGRLGTALAGRTKEVLAEKLRKRPVNFILRYGDGRADNFDPAAGVDIIPDGRHFWADPFFLPYRGETYIFFEDFDDERGRGHISVGRIREGRFEFIGPALVTENHLSYPYVFEDGGEIYLIPESYGAGRLEVWRLRQFPDKWEICATALEGALATDNVLTPVDGQWWLFTNISNDSYIDHCSELHLYKVDGIALKSLQPHPLNPVVIDSTTARGGGRVFRHDGRLLRSSQNNSHGVYGYGLNLMEIRRLDMERYEESLYRRIDPDFEPDVNGCHHVDFLNGKYVMDIRRNGRRRIDAGSVNSR